MAKILILEDDVRLELTYVTIFEKEGHEVLLARDGKEGLAMAESENPDLILVDMLMPQMNGLDFMRAYDKPNNHPDVKIIAFSNIGSDTMSLDAKKYGASRYLVKAKHSPHELANIISEVLDEPN